MRRIHFNWHDCVFYISRVYMYLYYDGFHTKKINYCGTLAVRGLVFARDVFTLQGSC